MDGFEYIPPISGKCASLLHKDVGNISSNIVFGRAQKSSKYETTGLLDREKYPPFSLYKILIIKPSLVAVFKSKCVYNKKQKQISQEDTEVGNK